MTNPLAEKSIGLTCIRGWTEPVQREEPTKVIFANSTQQKSHVLSGRHNGPLAPDTTTRSLSYTLLASRWDVQRDDEDMVPDFHTGLDLAMAF